VARPEERGDEETSERTCLVTRVKAGPRDMIRFVVGPGATVVPDIRRNLPGRGVWVLGYTDNVAEAVKRQAFSRGFKLKVTESPDLAVEIERELRRDCLQALSIANKAAQVVAGFVNVQRAIASGAISALIHAADCSPDGVRKLGQCLRRRYGDERTKSTVSLFRSEELDVAMGLTNVTHAALMQGAASEGFLDRCRRFEVYRSGSSQAKGAARIVWPTENVESLRDVETERAGTQDG
jgi:uncharacterized protein